MKIEIDTENKTLICETEGKRRKLDLYSKEAFDLISRQWLKVGWNQKYTYMFTWLGRPIIQLPEDILRVQEAVYRVKPDVIIETGVAHGGSLILYASLCKAMGNGRVIGVDIVIKPHNRRAIEHHELSGLIVLIEGDSTDLRVVNSVKSMVRAGEKVIVLLDSCHTKAHVLAELEAYCEVVSPGSYIVAQDGIMSELHDTPRGSPEWLRDNPDSAINQFLSKHAEFSREELRRPFDESEVRANLTYWPGAWLRRSK